MRAIIGQTMNEFNTLLKDNNDANNVNNVNNVNNCNNVNNVNNVNLDKRKSVLQKQCNLAWNELQNDKSKMIKLATIRQNSKLLSLDTYFRRNNS